MRVKQIHITAKGFEEYSEFWKQDLKWTPEYFLLSHESDTSY